jgi:hypothetical protein
MLGIVSGKIRARRKHKKEYVALWDQDGDWKAGLVSFVISE